MPLTISQNETVTSTTAAIQSPVVATQASRPSALSISQAPMASDPISGNDDDVFVDAPSDIPPSIPSSNTSALYDFHGQLPAGSTGPTVRSSGAIEGVTTGAEGNGSTNTTPQGSSEAGTGSVREVRTGSYTAVAEFILESIRQSLSAY